MEKLEQIERYLTGELSAEERQGFEQQLLLDAELKAEVEDYRDLVAGIEMAGVAEFEQRMQGWEARIKAAETPSVSGQIRPLWQRYLAVAATVVILCMLGYIFWPKSPAPLDPDSLFAEHFEPMEDYLSLKGNASLKDSAMTHYNTRQYAEAISLFEQILNGDSTEALVQLYSGISYLADNQPSMARTQLEPLVQEGSAYAESAAWYLVLADVKEGNLVLARKQLLQISSQENNAYQQSAQKLLAQLEP